LVGGPLDGQPGTEGSDVGEVLGWAAAADLSLLFGAGQQVVQRARGRADPARVADQRVTEPGSRYIDFLIPGLLGMNLMGSGLWGVGFSVVQARTKKLLKRFMATPMRRSHYLLSFILSRLVFLFVEVAALRPKREEHEFLGIGEGFEIGIVLEIFVDPAAKSCARNAAEISEHEIVLPQSHFLEKLADLGTILLRHVVPHFRIQSGALWTGFAQGVTPRAYREHRLRAEPGFSFRERNLEPVWFEKAGPPKIIERRCRLFHRDFSQRPSVRATEPVDDR